MGRIIATFQMTLDGVFDHVDEWYVSADDEQRASHELLFASDALLLGRETYEGLSAYWMRQHDALGFADRLNAIPKFVVSRTRTGPLEWNATLIEGDVEAAVCDLKGRFDTIVSYGFGELGAFLVEHGLLDELRVGVFPHIHGGSGLRLTSPRPIGLRAAGMHVLASGITILSYVPRRT
ncbi:dihydrofolate reductase family protein [Agromyces sp. Soil535]|uniref:dihydrofolate reductase family protein n=1 Tax=Agromyces sp. Soil535 TaxID=1736390 RepID=UPI0006F409CC|nr:dihydrofolate reductase family protein [Agromyces sp. Soil535]KRE30394.1 hypothetical protein ASG80_16680 [Agromyces sp. Soil535]